MPPEMIAPGVSHSFAGRCGHAGNESNDRLFHVVAHPECSHFFVVAADFADHHYCIGFVIFIE